MGIDPDRLSGPIVGIGSTWTGTMPCNLTHRELAAAVARGVEEAGGVPLEFNTIAVSDNQSQGTPGMRASLVSRELIADSIELMDVAHDFDALVCIVGCDKTVPAALMALARIDKPALVLYSGPMRPGANGATILEVWEGVGAFQRGLIGRDELDELERTACPGPGTCAGNFTANTMGLACEFLGIAPLGHTMAPADDLDERRRAAAGHGALATRLATTARTFLDRRALRNAMAGIAATGGSTNGLLHLLAIAREADVELELGELVEISARTPVIGSLSPSGRYVATDLHEIGGAPVVIAELIRAGLIDGDAPTVGGTTLAEGTAHAAAPDGAVVHAVEQPYKPPGGLVALRGNLAPEGAVVKVSGAEMRHHAGPARVFESEETCSAAIASGAVAAGRRAGDPQRGPGRRPRHARDAERHLRGGRRGPRRVGDARDRRPLLRRHARADGRPREPRGGARRPHRGRSRGRPHHGRRRRRGADRGRRRRRAVTAAGRVCAAGAAVHARRARALLRARRLGLAGGDTAPRLDDIPRPGAGPLSRFLVTGAFGAIGVWTIRSLLDRGHGVISFEISEQAPRLALALEPGEAERITRVRGDIADLNAVERALDEHAIEYVIHLAALQVPFVRADPPLGARVDVLGTVNVFEAVRRRKGRIAPVVYASSIAALGDDDHPSTLYGVFKWANEGTAERYFEDYGVSSIGLRPHTVYGPGRDQGLTSAPTMALVAAAAGVGYRIPFGGSVQMQYTSDVGEAFVRASEVAIEGAPVHNLDGPEVSMPELIELIEAAAPESAGLITATKEPLPFPSSVDGSAFAELLGGSVMRPIAAGVTDSLERFRVLLADGRVKAPTAHRDAG